MQYIKLGEVISSAKVDRCGDNDYPVLSITKSEGLMLQSDKFKKRIASNDTNQYKIVKKGQLVQGIHIDEANFGIQSLVEEGIVSPAYKIWDVNTEMIVPKYLEILLRSPRSIRYYSSKFNGSIKRRERITDNDFLSMVIPCPSMTEQQYAVDIVEKVRKLILLRKTEIEKHDELINARFVEMFGTVDHNVFNYPIVRLGDYAKLQGGYAFKSKDFVSEGIPLVQIGNVNKDYLDWGVINAVPNEYLDRYGEFSLHNGDLVMAMTRPIIKSLNSVKIAKVGENDVPSLLNQRVGRFILSNSLDSLFLETLCKSNDFKYYVERLSGNSLQPNISSKQVEDFMIILPPIELQEKFSDFVCQVDKSKVTIQKPLNEAQLLFDSLMQKYFG